MNRFISNIRYQTFVDLMVLVIPSIEITRGKCACSIQGLPDSPKIYPDDPVEVAQIWRNENAKALYIIDIDGENFGRPQNWEVLEKIADKVDIPIIVEGGFKNYDDVKKANEIGILRIVMDMDTFEDISLLKELVEEFTSKRICFKITAKNGRAGDLDAIEIASKVKSHRIERVVYEDLTDDGCVNFKALENFALKVDLKITAKGELNGYPDLKKLTEFEKLNVDSIVMNKSLYYNKFPCQYLWRLAEAEVDL